MAMEGKIMKREGFETRVENTMKNGNNQSRIRAWWWRRAGWWWCM